jgi:hypothetical protein
MRETLSHPDQEVLMHARRPGPRQDLLFFCVAGCPNWAAPPV